MKLIPLTQGKFAIVDDEDFERLNKHKWYARKSRHTFYAARQITIGKGKQGTFFMHREILNIVNLPEIEIDHKNRNGLDNQKENIRKCTNRQNSINRRKPITNTSGYRGVCFHKASGKWAAQIRIQGKGNHLGLFSSPIHAALAYNIAALNAHEELAQVNELPL